MRILLIVDDYLPSTKSGAKMMADLALELVRTGHQVTVVTPSDSVERSMVLELVDGVTVLRVRIGSLKNTNRILRGWRESRLSPAIWRRASDYFKANACDLIVFYSPSIFFGGLVRRLRKLWKCPAYLVLRDIFPKWAVDAGIIGKGLLYRYLRQRELAQYAAADVIGVETPGNLDYFHTELASYAYRVEVMLNWMDPAERPPCGSGMRARLGLEGKTVFFYGGNIGVAQDMDNIVRLANSLRDRKDIFFLLVGSGTEVKRLEQEIANRTLSNIRILPPIRQKDYLEAMVEFDVGLVTLDRRLRSHNVPGKVLGYMQCAMPVLASLNSGNDLGAILREHEAGIAVENGDDSGLRDAAILLATNAELGKRMGENARRLGETVFSVRNAALQILGHVQAPPQNMKSALSQHEDVLKAGA